MFDRLGDILRDRLDTDEDPFDTWEPETGKPRQAGNARTRTPPQGTRTRPRQVAVPAELAGDFAVLGLAPGVGEDECKKAWKKLLMTHHPDRNAGNKAEQERSTQISTRINDSYRRICRWYATGTIG